MGGGESKQENNVENSAAVQNNITVEKPLEVHNRENTILLGILCAIQLIEMLIYLYKTFRRGLKRQLIATHRPQAEEGA